MEASRGTHGWPINKLWQMTLGEKEQYSVHIGWCCDKTQVKTIQSSLMAKLQMPTQQNLFSPHRRPHIFYLFFVFGHNFQGQLFQLEVSFMAGHILLFQHSHGNVEWKLFYMWQTWGSILIQVMMFFLNLAIKFLMVDKKQDKSVFEYGIDDTNTTLWHIWMLILCKQFTAI